MSDKPLFSIILPSYKVEDYLETAVLSIINQTFKDCEIIIVDDASPDKTGEIADGFSRSYSFIKVIHHQTNLGLSEARNSGLHEASGEFVFFMDPDDTVENDLLETVKVSLDEHPSNVIVFGLVEEYYNDDNQLSNSVLITHSNQQLFFYTKEEIRKEMILLERETLLGYAWNKIYNRDYLSSIGAEFETVEFIEDIVFNLKVFKDLESLTILSNPLYHYAKRVNAGLTSKYSESFYDVHKKRVELLVNQYDDWGMLDENVINILGCEYARFIFSSAQRNCNPKSGMRLKERLSFIRSIYSEELYNVLIPNCSAQNLSVRVMLCLLKKKSVYATACISKLLYIIKRYFPVFFSKIKQKR